MTKPLTIHWDTSCEIGVSSVDTEHRMLCIAYNTFIKQLGRSRGSLPTDYAISFLEEYLEYHHRNEEALMAEVHYDRFKEHVHGHKAIERRLAEIKTKRSNGDCIKQEMHNFFMNCLMPHMAAEDRDIGVYLRSVFRYSKRNIKDSECETHEHHHRHQHLESKRLCITNRDSRVFARYAVDLLGRLVTYQGHALRVVVENLSQGGARIDSSTGLFKGATGILRMPTTDHAYPVDTYTH